MVTVAILYMYSIIDGLMWVNFEQKCVKLYTFSILHLLRRLLLILGIHKLLLHKGSQRQKVT